MSRQSDYTTEVYQAGIDAGLPEHIARLAATQSSLESGYGKSVKGNNYFGIKAGSSWKGKTQTFQTHEVENGKTISKKDKFRAYSSPEESLADWADTIAKKFPDVMKSENFNDAVKALDSGVHGKYATDPNYGSKLKYIQNNFLPETGSPASNAIADKTTPPFPQEPINRQTAFTTDPRRPLSVIPSPPAPQGIRGAPGPRNDPRSTPQIPEANIVQASLPVQPTTPEVVSRKPLSLMLEQSQRANAAIRDYDARTHEFGNRFGTSIPLLPNQRDERESSGISPPQLRDSQQANRRVRIADADPDSQAAQYVLPGRPANQPVSNFDVSRPQLSGQGRRSSQNPAVPQLPPAQNGRSLQRDEQRIQRLQAPGGIPDLNPDFNIQGDPFKINGVGLGADFSDLAAFSRPTPTTVPRVSSQNPIDLLAPQTPNQTPRRQPPRPAPALNRKGPLDFGGFQLPGIYGLAQGLSNDAVNARGLFSHPRSDGQQSSPTSTPVGQTRPDGRRQRGGFDGALQSIFAGSGQGSSQRYNPDTNKWEAR